MTDRLPIKMLHDRVLVREPRDEGERKSSGGILIPATAQVAKRLIWAEVLAVGNHVRAVELGDRVLFSPRSASMRRVDLLKGLLIMLGLSVGS